MPRRARDKSQSGIYHIILRGTNRQEIFHDEEDSIKFLETLARYKKKAEIQLYGWCLMGNHIHLLMAEGNEELSVSMKRMEVSFVWYYNLKYNATGHLFQDRYRSEKVDSDEYLLTVVRYIHQNPVTAGIVGKPADWKWSSCSGYFGEKVYPPGLLDSDFILELFSENRIMAVKKFKEFNEKENEDRCLEEDKNKRLTDERAREEIRKVLNGIEITEVKSMPKLQRDEILVRVKEIKGVTQRQAARILGISANLIFKA